MRCWGMIGCCLAWQAAAVGQPVAPLGQGDGIQQTAVGSGVIRLAPRDLRRQIDRAEQALQQGRESDALELLWQVLHGARATGPDSPPRQDDYFLAATEHGTSAQSMRRYAAELVRGLSDAGREAYQLRVDVDARAALDRAMQQRDLEAVRHVVRAFRLSDAAAEALLLLARSELDAGHPRAAMRHLQQLHSDRRSDRQLEPARTTLLALAALHAGETDRAMEAWNELARGQTGLPWDGGNRVVAEARDATAIEQTIGPVHRPVAPTVPQWQLHRGAASRNGQSATAGQPLPFARWRVRVALTSPEEERHLVTRASDMIHAGEPVIPTLMPLALDQTVLMRATDRVVAIDFQSGKYLWEWPWQETEETADLVHGMHDEDGTPARSIDRLEQRVWDDVPYGQLASDGRHVFFLHALDSLPTPSRFRRGLTAGAPTASLTNELIALDVRSEGKFRWQVGGAESTAAPELAGIFFLGPPLPLGDELFLIGEISGEILLVVLDRDTGQLRWQQQLAYVEPGSIAYDAIRRRAGATPSYADGLLICPTGCGALVAVDRTTRDLAWAFQYPRAQTRTRRGRVWTSSFPLAQRNARWLDAAPILCNGRVITTPPESDQLYCLDLVNGTELWSMARAGDEQSPWWFVAAASQQQILIVGQRRLMGVGLEDGQARWGPVAIPSDAVPTGRGFWNAGRYFLPTSAPSLLEIAIEEGALTSHATDVPLGNTVSVGDQIITQSPSDLRAYYQLPELRVDVDHRLADNPNDAWALERRGQIDLADGDATRAAESFRQVMATYRDDDPRKFVARHLLLDALLDMLRSDIGNEAIAAEARTLVDSPAQAVALLQLRVDSLLQVGRVDPAAEAFLEIERLSGSPDTWRGTAHGTERRFVLEPGWTVDESRWLRARMRTLWKMASPAQRTAIDGSARTRLTAILQEDRTSDLERFAAIYEPTPAGGEALQSLAERVADRSDLLGAELAYQTLIDNARRPGTAEPVAKCVAATRHFEKTQQVRHVEYALHALAQLDHQTIWQGKTPVEWVHQLENEVTSDALSRWQSGRIESVLHEPVAAQPRAAALTETAVAVEQVPAYAQSNWSVAVDRRQQIKLRNEHGREIGALRIPGETIVPAHTLEAVSLGSLLVLATPNHVSLIDTSLERADPQDMIRWSVSLADTGQAQQRVSPRLRPVPNWPWGDGGTMVVTPDGKRFGKVLGPLSTSGICFLRPGSITCVDPATGSRLWERPYRGTGSHLFGDSDYVMAVSEGGVRADVFSMTDGTLLGTRPLPPPDKRWHVVGRNLLSWQPTSDNDWELEFRDIWEQEVLWQQRLPRGTRGAIDDNFLGLCTPTGHLTIRDLLSQSVVVDEMIEPEPDLAALGLDVADEQFLVVIDTHPSRVASDGERISTPPGSSGSVRYGRYVRIPPRRRTMAGTDVRRPFRAAFRPTRLSPAWRVDPYTTAAGRP